MSNLKQNHTSANEEFGGISLTREEERFLMIIKERYNLINKLTSDIFVVGENYNF